MASPCFPSAVVQQFTYSVQEVINWMLQVEHVWSQATMQNLLYSPQSLTVILSSASGETNNTDSTQAPVKQSVFIDGLQIRAH
ncbi:hypothetical protein Q7C36_002023 [Tachysurus vachellii]|uniref:Uncharacterized protein n=1 Tax=Tachysurus vachellii TaxID=175792 RepID=A0AA88T620_TACVA|nr:hypothetical protein Q7C36_002023 [Tachysurus vachellii]